MDLSVATRLTPSPRDLSPALAIAIPIMKSVNIVPAQCFDNMAFHSERSEEGIERDSSGSKTSRQESTESNSTVKANNIKNELYADKSLDYRVDARTPLLRDHKIESLDETKLRDNKVEKRKSSAST
ncbi:unnamed protein product, partial [Iphiclides podalirius]